MRFVGQAVAGSRGLGADQEPTVLLAKLVARDPVGLEPGLAFAKRELFAAALATEDRIEGVEALLQGRKPDFSGR